MTHSTPHNTLSSPSGEPAEELFGLGYVSRSVIDQAPDVLDAALTVLVTDAKHRNAKLGITGKLLYGHGYFMQVIEGNPDAVEQLFSRIQLDKRHQDVRLMFFEPLSQRVFQDWSMALDTLGDEDYPSIAQIHGLPGHIQSRSEGLLSLVGLIERYAPRGGQVSTP